MCRRGRIAVGCMVSLLRLELLPPEVVWLEQGFLLTAGKAKPVASQGSC